MFFDRHQGGETAILIHPELSDDREREDPQEFMELARSAGIESLAFISVNTRNPSPRYFVGPGKVEEIRQAVLQHEAEVVLVNHALSPSQARNLEKELECKVVDRTGLILDIFAQRARTFEGKLQVELAQLEYVSTRLIRGWTHLERQKGGIGLRGPGETQLETDRRLLRARIKNITKRLEKVRKQRDQGRRSRKRAEVPQISLVGYTNAGKSTLFNSMTASDVYAQDQLFATLDPTLRRLELDDLGPVILADTVGFIRHLPHKLVEAFRATLEETRQADLLLHIIDAHDPERLENIKQVNDVLEEIDADEVPSLHIYNKIDLLEGVEPKIQRDDEGKPERVWVSAKTGAGLELIEQAITELLGNDMIQGRLSLTPAQGKIRARLFQAGAIRAEEYSDKGELLLDIRMPRGDYERIAKQEGLSAECLAES